MLLWLRAAGAREQYAPAALVGRSCGDSVRPRRLSGVVGRPLNFTVRRRVGRPRQDPGLDASPTGAVRGSNCRRGTALEALALDRHGDDRAGVRRDLS
jgi:hypothetical protein